MTDEASASTTSEEPTEARAPGADAAGGAPEAHVCNVGFCPIGLALTSVQPMRPEVVEHLLVAGREFVLAMQAVVSARAEQFAGEGVPTDLQKIDIG
jgi:hypothetical protein